MKYQLKIDTQDFTVEVGELNAGSVQVAVNGINYDVIIADSGALAQPAVPAEAAAPSEAPPKPAATPATPAKKAPVSGGAVLAPIPGLILDVKVKVGDAVQVGQAVAVMEAMKMENELTTNVAGVVKEILVQKGSEVSTGDTIMRIA